MKINTWIHLFLHAGCVALLLFQGHRIQQLRLLAAHPSQNLRFSDQQMAEVQLRKLAIGYLLMATQGSPGDTLEGVITFWENGQECFRTGIDSKIPSQ